MALQLQKWSLLLLVFLFFSSRMANALIHDLEKKYLQDQAKEMFYHGYRNYMKHAFPWDELKPLSCEGRRWDQRERGDLDDVLGGFSLTLIDSLDMLAIIGDREEFVRAVNLVIKHVTFDRNVEVSVFESTIRVIGGLISAHMLASPKFLGIMTEEEYHDELLNLAVDLGKRLLPAFDTPTGLPVHRINLKKGMLQDAPSITCPAAAGSLLVEMSYLSRLSDINEFEEKARNAVLALWLRRSNLDLLGSAIDVFSGEWLESHVSIGAGLDSYFEYLLKYHVVSGNSMFLQMFNISYNAVESHINHDDMHIEVDMHFGRRYIRSRRVSALQAFWPGLQVLAGYVSSAIRSHEKLFELWNKFGAMPELFDLTGKGSVISWARTSPLRPELIESTYHLYQATRDHKYLKIGRKLLQDIQKVSKVKCGYAAVGNIHTLSVEDRMDSYFLSETVKYLYLLFSEDPDLIVPSFHLPSSSSSSLHHEKTNGSEQFLWEQQGVSRPLKSSQVVFSTEGHILMLDPKLFQREFRSVELYSIGCENANRLVKSSSDNSASNNKHEVQKRAVEQIAVSIRSVDQHVITVVATGATFGHEFTQKHIEAPLFLYSPKIGEACTIMKDDANQHISGKVVMIKRGGCSFVDKAKILQRAGATGMILINNKSATSVGMQKYLITDENDEGSSVKIPVIMISREDAGILHRDINLHIASGGYDEGDEFMVLLSPWLL